MGEGELKIEVRQRVYGRVQGEESEEDGCGISGVGIAGDDHQEPFGKGRRLR
jgi:hypothetical protein